MPDIYIFTALVVVYDGYGTGEAEMVVVDEVTGNVPVWAIQQLIDAGQGWLLRDLSDYNGPVLCVVRATYDNDSDSYTVQIIHHEAANCY